MFTQKLNYFALCEAETGCEVHAGKDRLVRKKEQPSLVKVVLSLLEGYHDCAERVSNIHYEKLSKKGLST